MAGIQTIDINGAALAYRVHARTPGAPPLVFAHGYAMRSTGEAYADLLEALAQAFTVHALDLRGHGGSAGAVEGWSLEALADDVVAFARALGLADAVYVGHSIGGFTGLHAAIRHPGVFRALCLLATAPGVGGRSNPAGIGELFIAQGRDRDAMRQAFAPMYLRAGPEAVDLAAESVGEMDPAVHRAFFSSFADFSLTDRLPQISVPVLLVNGLRDVVVPPDEQHATALALPLCKEINLSTEGHMLPMEAPALVAREITAFCAHDLDEAFAPSGR